MRVLVTGPDGLLGSNLVRQLLAQGYEVRALVFPGSTSTTLSELPIERHSGNILHQDEVNQAVQGCDAVIHAAASTAVWPTRSAKIWAVNLQGAQNIAQAVLENKLQRLVYISSASAYRPGPKTRPGTETSPLGNEHYGLDYVDSKLAGQIHILNQVKEQQLPAVLINPTFMFGPYDSLPSSGKMIIAQAQNQLPGYTDGGKNFVHVQDVAQAAINALQQGRIGECYIAGNANLSYLELFEIMAQITGGKVPRIKMPNALVAAYGYLGTALGKLSGKAPNLSHATARVAIDHQFYSPEKAVRELNMPQTPIEAAIQDAFDWFKNNNYL